MNKKAMKETITTYKGFDSDMKCRGFRFEVGKSYEHEGEVKVCESGFHACENPLDVLYYYAPADSTFAVVEQSGSLDRSCGDGKVASSEIKINAQISIDELVEAAVAYTTSRCDAGGHERVSNTRYRGVASNPRDCAVASNAGLLGVASSTGD